MCNVHPAPQERTHILAALASATMVGGHILVVGHDHSDFSHGHGGPAHSSLHYTTHALSQDRDVVAVPSQWPEPLGAVALEAMAAGVPVLVADVGGMAELVTDRQTGRLVAPGNPVVWAQALAELAADPATAQALGHAGKAVAAQHSVERHLAELGAIVADLR